jgi:hypothetical protein
MAWCTGRARDGRHEPFPEEAKRWPLSPDPFIQTLEGEPKGRQAVIGDPSNEERVEFDNHSICLSLSSASTARFKPCDLATVATTGSVKYLSTSWNQPILGTLGQVLDLPGRAPRLALSVPPLLPFDFGCGLPRSAIRFSLRVDF